MASNEKEKATTRLVAPNSAVYLSKQCFSSHINKRTITHTPL